MNLGEAFYEALVGVPTDESQSFGELLNRLIVVSGGVGKAAGLLGVNPKTFYRWRHGRAKPKTGETTVRRVLRRALLTRDRERTVKRKVKTLVIVGLQVIVSSDRRNRRKLAVGQHIPASTIGRIVDLWKLGDDNKTEAALWRAIDKYYAEGLEIGEIESAYFS